MKQHPPVNARAGRPRPSTRVERWVERRAKAWRPILATVEERVARATGGGSW